MSHFTIVWLKENQVRLVGSYRSFTCIYISDKSVLQDCATSVPYKSVLQGCPIRVSYKLVLQECPRRVSHKRVSSKSV